MAARLTPPVPQTRLPLAALMVASGAAGASELAGYLGRPVRTVQRWNVEGVPYWTADRLCASLHMHPTEAWPLFDTIHPTKGVPTP